MMSAEQFARQSAVWHRATPTLENFMRWANDNLFGIGELVPSSSRPERNSLLAEIAFRSLFSSSEAAEQSARAFIAKLPRGDMIGDGALNESERSEVAGLRTNIDLYIARERDSSSVWTANLQPRLPGCGVVESANADLLLGSELVEIKAVRRPFRSTDIRQAITYAALSYSTGAQISRVTLLNPRLGSFFTARVEDLAPDIGAGSWPELMNDLIDAMSGLEVSL